jgi:ribosomal protein S18 acetylase RimI-like enzyme
MSIAIREAQERDIEAIADLVNRTYRGKTSRVGWTHEADILSGQRIDAKMVRSKLGDPACTMLVAEERGVVIGCVEVADQGEAAYIGLLTVEPGRQGGGLGRRLAEAAEALGRSRGFRTAKMTVIAVREELIAWYERLGYRRTGAREPFPVDEPRVGRPLKADLEFIVPEKPV